MQDNKRCRTRTQRYRHIKPRTNATTTTNHNYMNTPNPKNKNRKNTISLSLYHRRSRLPSIPEQRQILHHIHNLPPHQRRTVTSPRHHRHRDQRKIPHSDPIHNHTHSPTTLTPHTTPHQPRSNIKADSFPDFPSLTDNSRNYPNSIGNNTQRSILPTEKAPPTTDPTTIHTTSPVPVTPLDSQFNLPARPLPRITTASMALASDNPVKMPEPTLPNILDSAATGDSFEECMRQQEKCFLDTMAEIQQHLLLAQKAFETQLQLFIAHCNAMQTSQPPHLSTNSPNHCTRHLAAIRSTPEQNTTNQSVDSLAATWRYPSSLNTQFLLPSGNYNNAATGVHWFKSSLFCLLPFQQRTKVKPISEIRTVYSDYFRHTQTATNITGSTSTSRPYVPATTEQVRPKFLLNEHSKPPYSNLPQHVLPQHQTKRTTTTLSSSHTDGGPIYRPPWPPPHESIGCPAISHSVAFKPGHYRPTNTDQSGHLGLITRLPTVYSRHNPQAYYRFEHRRPPLPPQYRIPPLHCVSLPKSLTEDKNLLRPP